MKFTKIFLIITVCFAVPGFGQVNAGNFDKEMDRIQKDLLSKLTGNVQFDVMTKVGGEKNVAARKGRGTLTDRSTGLARTISADLLYESLRKIGLSPERHKYKTKSEGTNIYSVLRATVKSDEYVVLGAHYDSVKDSPGANDNASGTTLVYGVAFKLAKLKVRTRNFIIVFFDQEELGLVGSRAFAKKLMDDGLNIHSVHTVDQMGWDEDGDRAIELELPTPDLEKLYREEAGKLSIIAHKTDVPSTDHTAFREIGFNAIGITEEYKNHDTTPHYHRPSDTFETIDLDYLASSTRLVFNVMKRLASE